MDIKKNEGQEAVINTTEGQLIVIACPGSGKTTTLVRRIHHMVADCNIPSESILMVTFSNAAAKEMRERYQKSYGKDDVTFSTIHSLCFAILRKFAGYSNEDILTDARDYFYKKLRGNKQVNDKEEFINSILTEISVIKNNQIPLDDYNPICCNDKTLFEDLFTGYEEYKNDLKVVDFDDMLIQAYQTMKDNKNCLQWLRNKYRYIQVDEYQDTNYLQRDIIYLLAGENGNLTVVGDDDQSIYGFRGARPQVMLNFKKDYPNAVMIRLSTNYRSSKEIIHSADNLIKLNKSRFDKEFLAFKSEAGQIEYMPTPTREYEISKVTMKIKELLKSGEKPEDIAVLYRTNSQAEAVADSLLMANIPFHSNEKISNRYEHWMFYDIQAFYALANDKSQNVRKDIARVLNHPNRYLLDPAYFKAGLDKKKMRSAAFKTGVPTWKTNNALDEIEDFFYGLGRLRDKDPETFLSLLLRGMSYRTYLKEYAEFRNMDVSDLNSIYEKYKEDAKEHNSWSSWGVYINRYKRTLKEASKNKTGVTLSTMHSSKGLEWKHVFIIDCVEGICPFKKAKTDADFEEERRLFYVAMTRAKQYLYLCTYEQSGNKSVNPSPYLKSVSQK